MNTANLELEGLYLAIAAINNHLVERGLFTHLELQQLLSDVEVAAKNELSGRDLSRSNQEAVLFPLRFLRVASECCDRRETIEFQSIVRHVGRQS